LQWGIDADNQVVLIDVAGSGKVAPWEKGFSRYHNATNLDTAFSKICRSTVERSKRPTSAHLSKKHSSAAGDTGLWQLVQSTKLLCLVNRITCSMFPDRLIKSKKISDSHRAAFADTMATLDPLLDTIAVDSARSGRVPTAPLAKALRGLVDRHCRSTPQQPRDPVRT
jgi:hypothetical protein